VSKTFGLISKLLGKGTEAKSELNEKPNTDSPTPTKYQITPEVLEILDLIESSDGNVIFVTGAAGTGKSTLIDIIRSVTRKKLVVVAPTGVAAINCGGQTTHSFFQLTPGPQPKPQVIRGMNGPVVKELEVLIIDEVSMVRADLIDSIAESLRINTKNHQTPFAAKTIVLIGDMHQLPPVVATSKEKQLFQDHYDTPYFFSAKALQTVLTS